MNVEQFIAHEVRRPLIWGVTDCAATFDRWVYEVTGVSPAAASGQIWRDEETGRALLGCRALPLRVARGMRAIGIRSVSRCDDGDVAAVAFGDYVTCPIFLGGLWHFRGPLGRYNSYPNGRVLMAWGLG